MLIRLGEWYAQTPILWFLFWATAVVASLFFGWKCFDIHGVNIGDAHWSKRWHQHWVNFVGSLFGWAAFWIVFRKVCIYPSPVGWFDAAMMAVAYIGIIGYIPFVAHSLMQGVTELTKKFLKTSS